MSVTRPRVAVPSTVHAHPHADPDSIFGFVRENLSGVSRYAVYDVLHVLTAADLVRRFEPMGSAAPYEVRSGDKHQHLVCRSCGAVAEVHGVAGSAACLMPTDDSGYEVDRAEAVFWRRCARCVAAPDG